MQARESMAGLLVRYAAVCLGGIPRIPLGMSEFGCLEKVSPQADTVLPINQKKNPNIPLKLILQVPIKQLIRKSELAGLFCWEVFF